MVRLKEGHVKGLIRLVSSSAGARLLVGAALLAVAIAGPSVLHPVPHAKATGPTVVQPYPNPMFAGLGASSVNLTVQASNVPSMPDCGAPPFPPLCGGLGGYRVDLTWDPGLLTMTSFGNSSLLGSTGRSVTCITETQTTSHLVYTCFTTGATPAGPGDTSGPLMSLRFTSLGPLDSVAPLTLTATLSDLVGNPVTHTDMDGAVRVHRCADVVHNGAVSALTDVPAMIAHVGTKSTSPGWDPTFDLNRDNAVTALLDVPYLVGEIGQFCTWVP